MVISTALLIAWSIIYRPKRLPILIIIITLISLLSHNQWTDKWHQYVTPLLDKQQTVGLNLRGEELSAVTNELDNVLSNHIWGLGWGAGIESPSSQGNVVNFTHNLFSSLWLKTGSIGVCLMLAFLITLGIQFMKNLKLNAPHPIILFLSLFLCLSINMLLYGGYKSLGFGLCLTLFVSICFSEEKHENSKHSIA